MRGKLIVFEGGEGSGKTTQIKRLYDWLGKSEAFNLLQSTGSVLGVKMTREPGGNALGQQIRQLLLDERWRRLVDGELPAEAPIANRAELLLYAADRAQHVEETLVPWLEKGYWVLCDRYTDSTVAYQGYGRQLSLSLIGALNRIATTYCEGQIDAQLKSDLTFWLNVSPAIGLARMHQRGQADRIEQASQRFHQRVSEGFAALAAANGEMAALSSGPTEEIAGDRPIDVIATHIQTIIHQRIAQWYPPLL
ncbi:MAG: dTMP kinase [Phormidesmis sp.]